MKTAPINDPATDDRRAYWRDRMDEAFSFMQNMRTYPFEESQEGMVSLLELVDGIEIEFSSTKINETFPRQFFIRQGLADSFRALAKEANSLGWVVKVEDGYRTPEMQRALSHSNILFDTILKRVIWEGNGQIPSPELMLQRVSALIATRCRVGTHISGSAIDVSILDRTTGKEIDRGAPYLELSEKTPMRSPFVDEVAQSNRRQIEELFLKHGWIAYPYEFWHFSKGDCYAEHLSGSHKPSRYGPINFDNGHTEFLSEAEADRLLEPLEFYREKIQQALRRAG